MNLNERTQSKDYFQQIAFNIKNRKYQFIGEGSGRVVYDLDNGYVVKVAKNRRGIAQNEAEYKIASEDKTHIFCRILHASEDFKYLIVEKAEKVKHISYVWNYYKVKSNSGLLKQKEIQDISHRYHLELKDLRRSSNWGQINGRPIIVDYGFTRQVRRKYY